MKSVIDNTYSPHAAKPLWLLKKIDLQPHLLPASLRASEGIGTYID